MVLAVARRAVVKLSHTAIAGLAGLLQRHARLLAEACKEAAKRAHTSNKRNTQAQQKAALTRCY